MKQAFKLLVLPGDGIGPEVVAAGLRVFEFLCSRESIPVEIKHDLLQGAAWDEYGVFCRDETVEAAKFSNALLVGACGGPKWDALGIEGTPAERDGLMRLREELDTFACLRPARAFDSLLDRTPFRSEIVKNADVLVLRELCGGLPYGEPRGIDQLDDGSFQAYDANFYTSHEIRRVAEVGFELARQRRGKLTSFDKANVMESSVLWRRIVSETHELYPDIELEHLYADNGLYQMVRDPRAFDVILGDNIFGDLASDLAASYSGSLGMLPSVSLAEFKPDQVSTRPAIYEPVHGSAPDIMGQGIANPIGTILSVAMMFEYSLQHTDLSRQIEQAVEKCLEAGVMSPDLGGQSTSSEVCDSILQALDR